jgi:hypothetical protein
VRGSGGAEEEGSRLGGSGSGLGGALSKGLVKVGCLGESSGGGGGGSGDPRPRPTPENTAKDRMPGEEGTAGSPQPRPTDAVATKGARGCLEVGRPRSRPCPKPSSPPSLLEE